MSTAIVEKKEGWLRRRAFGKGAASSWLSKNEWFILERGTLQRAKAPRCEVRETYLLHCAVAELHEGSHFTLLLDTGKKLKFEADATAEAEEWVQALNVAALPPRHRIRNDERVAAFFAGSLKPYPRQPPPPMSMWTVAMQAGGVVGAVLALTPYKAWVRAGRAVIWAAAHSNKVAIVFTEELQQVLPVLERFKGKSKMPIKDMLLGLYSSMISLELLRQVDPDRERHFVAATVLHPLKAIQDGGEGGEGEEGSGKKGAWKDVVPLSSAAGVTPSALYSSLMSCRTLDREEEAAEEKKEETSSNAEHHASPLPPVDPRVSAEMLDEMSLYLRLSIFATKQRSEETQMLANALGFVTVVSSPEATTDRPAFALYARNEPSKLCVLAIRGSASDQDWLSNARFKCVPLSSALSTTKENPTTKPGTGREAAYFFDENAKEHKPAEEEEDDDNQSTMSGINNNANNDKEMCHSGMLQAAKVLADDENVRAWIRRFRVSGYKVVLTGHSRGAGIASLLYLLLKREKVDDGISVRIFAPPACVSEDLADELCEKDTTLGLFVGDDMVPRLSVANMHALAADLAATRSEWGPPMGSTFSKMLLIANREALKTQQLDSDLGWKDFIVAFQQQYHSTVWWMHARKLQGESVGLEASDKSPPPPPLTEEEQQLQQQQQHGSQAVDKVKQWGISVMSKVTKFAQEKIQNNKEQNQPESTTTTTTTTTTAAAAAAAATVAVAMPSVDGENDPNIVDFSVGGIEAAGQQEGGGGGGDGALPAPAPPLPEEKDNNVEEDDVFVMISDAEEEDEMDGHVRLVPPGVLLHIYTARAQRHAVMVDHRWEGLRRFLPSWSMVADHRADNILTATQEAAYLLRHPHPPPTWDSLAGPGGSVCSLSGAGRDEMESACVRLLHCGKCGQLVDARHAAHFGAIPSLGVLRRVNVCDKCYFSREGDVVL